MTRILLYTGKGGVGKTSVAAATAVLAAQRGMRTLVVSTDIAHSLADALDTPVGPTPREIAPNLWAHEPDVFFNISPLLATIQSYFSSLFSWGGLDEVMAEEMTVLPGMDELGNLLWIGDHVDAGEYDLIVVDAAPTGETLRLLSLPEASRWWIEKIAPIGRRVQRLGGPRAPADCRCPAADRRGLRVGRAAPRAPGVRARPAVGSRTLVRSPGAQPGARLDPGGAAIVHVLPPVRLSRPT